MWSAERACIASIAKCIYQFELQGGRKVPGHYTCIFNKTQYFLMKYTETYIFNKKKKTALKY